MKKIIILLLLIFNLYITYGQRLIRRVDEFTGQITIESVSDDGDFNTSDPPISVIKVIDKNTIVYYLSVFAESNFCSVDGKDLYLLFQDNTVLKKTCDINVPKVVVSKGSYKYQYHAFVQLTQSDLNILSNKIIKKWKIYIFVEDWSYHSSLKKLPQCIKYLQNAK